LSIFLKSEAVDGISLDDDSKYGHELTLKIFRKALLFDVAKEKI